ncbi:MAG: hypothetical protein AAGA54_09535, partial [Myxococcota bacterium]
MSTRRRLPSLSTLLLVACFAGTSACRTGGETQSPGHDGADTGDSAGSGLTFHPSPPPKPEPEGKEDDAKKKDATWDVETAPGPRKTVTIDTDEGTWLSLTLSPDGK